MTRVFADTFYWVALANPSDDWHEKAKAISGALAPRKIVTTDEVLGEFVNWFRRRGGYWRAKAVQLARGILANHGVEVLHQTRHSFESGLVFFESRPDKDYSLTDCVSMHTLRQQGLKDVLTHDQHFLYEGFNPLLRDEPAV